VNLKVKLAAAELAQESSMRENAEALAAQATLLVGGQVMANALATSCGSTASKPPASKGPTMS
jgi:hypothetical protein